MFANYDYNMVDGKWVDCKPASQLASHDAWVDGKEMESWLSGSMFCDGCCSISRLDGNCLFLAMGIAGL